MFESFQEHINRAPTERGRVPPAFASLRASSANLASASALSLAWLPIKDRDFHHQNEINPIRPPKATELDDSGSKDKNKSKGINSSSETREI